MCVWWFGAVTGTVGLMTGWPQPEIAPNPSPSQSLGADLMGLGPASTPGRELLAAALQLGLVILLLFVLFPDRVPDPAKWLLLGAGVVFFVVRAAIGIPKWRRRSA